MKEKSGGLRKLGKANTFEGIDLHKFAVIE
jgi:hypothetical protein